MRAIAATVLGTLIALGALGAWYYTAPAAGSGWILFVAFLGCLGAINSNGKLILSALSCLAITVAAGAVWWLTRPLDHSGWVLFLAILGGLGTFGRINAITASATQKPKGKKSKKDAKPGSEEGTEAPKPESKE